MSAAPQPIQASRIRSNWRRTHLGPGTTVGVTTANTTPVGVAVGGQIGCDYQFSPHWVVGIEGAASGTNMKGSTTLGCRRVFPAILRK